MRKSISVFLSLTLLAATSPLNAAGSPGEFSDLIRPPAIMGSIVDHFDGAPGKRLILIQDLHAHLETQRKIAALLGYYQTTGLLQRPVAIEGASGVWDLKELGSFPVTDRKQALYNYLLGKAGITGAEWYALKTNQLRLLYGVDSFDDYAAQRDLFAATRPARELLANQLETTERALIRLEARDFSGRLAHWRKLSGRYDAGTIDSKEFFFKLNRLARPTALSSDDESLRRSIDARIALTHSDPSIEESLETDLARYGQRVGLALCVRASDRNLIKSLNAASWLKRLFRQQLIFRELQWLNGHAETAALLVNDLVAASGQGIWFAKDDVLDLVRASMDFYVAALVRDEPLARNALSLLQQPRSLAQLMKDVPETVILVAGGFHERGITQFLRSQNIGYDVVSPSITTDYTDADQRQYAARLSGEKVSLIEFARASKEKTSPSEPARSIHESASQISPEPIKDDEGISMFGVAAVQWFKAYLANLRRQPAVHHNWQIPQTNIDRGIKSLGWESKEFTKVSVSNGNVNILALGFHEMERYPQAAILLSKIGQIRFVRGSIKPEEMEKIQALGAAGAEATVDNLAGEFIYTVRVGGKIYSWVHENTLLPAADLMDPSIPELPRLLAYTFLFKEYMQGRREHLTMSLPAPGNDITEDDLAVYGATWNRVIEAVESGQNSDFLKDAARVLDIDLARLREEIARHRGRQQWRANVEAGIITDEAQLEVGHILLQHGQEQLFQRWGAPGTDDDKKRAMLTQAIELNQSYPGGLATYLDNIHGLIEAKRKGESRFKGKTPLPPPVIDVADVDDAVHSQSNYQHFEARGIAGMHKTALVLVAGGFGKRLGYNGIKLDIPISLISGDTYFDWYVKNILAFQKQSNALSGAHDYIPILIVVSDETADGTFQMLKERGYRKTSDDEWEKGDSHIIIARQGLVPVVDDKGKIQLDPKNRYAIAAQPHGHGDVHILIRRLGLARKWKAEGRDHVLFVQDTNGQSANALPVALGATIAERAGMTFVGVPRRPGDPVGLLATVADQNAVSTALERHHLEKLSDENLFEVLKKNNISSIEFRREVESISPTSVENVEYVIANEALKASVDPKGDVADPQTKMSPYPGNINVLVLALDPYIKALDKTNGLMPEIINFAKGPSRSETNMQDIADAMGEFAPVQTIRFANQHGEVFSVTKNSTALGVAAQVKGNTSDTAARSESDFYTGMRRRLALAGTKINVQGEPHKVQGVDIYQGAKIILMPNFANTSSEFLKKVRRGHISDRSVLIVDGEAVSLENLTLDGTLVIQVVDGATLELRDAIITNDASLSKRDVAAEGTPALAVRGYEYRLDHASEARFIKIDQPGQYRLGSSGKLEKLLNGQWTGVPDHAASSMFALPHFSERHSTTVRNRAMAAAGMLAVIFTTTAIALGVVQSLTAILLLSAITLLWSIPQILKVAGRGRATYDQGKIKDASSLMERLEEFLHVGNGQPDGHVESRGAVLYDEAIVHLLLTPIGFWAHALATLAGYFSGIFFSHPWTLSDIKALEMNRRVASLRTYESSGNTTIPSITGRPVQSGVSAISAPSHFFSHFFSYLNTVKEARRRETYMHMRATLSENFAA